MTRVICQNGVEGEFKTFGTAGRYGRAVTGTKENGNKYTIGEYKDGWTALTVLSQLIQHEGEEPFKMPKSDCEVKGN